MIGVIVFGIVVVFLIVLSIWGRAGFDFFIFSVVIVMFLSILTLFPLAIRGYSNVVKDYDEIMFKMQWMENHQDNLNMTDSLMLYEDIKEMNEEIRKGKAKCQNNWNGIFIDDEYLELKEIEVPKWLIPSN